MIPEFPIRVSPTKKVAEFYDRRRRGVLTRRLLIMLMLSFVFAQPLSSQRAVAQTQSMTPQQPKEYLDLPINIETPIQPIPVKGTDGKWYLVYHLFLTNWSFSDLTLKNVGRCRIKNAAKCGAL